MKVLVTGGAGFIGTHLCDALRARGHKAEVFDNYDPQVHGRVSHDDAKDVLDCAALQRALARAEAVVHLAAAVGVAQGQYQIKHYVDTNVSGTANILDILSRRRGKVRKVIVAGSMSAYGEGAYECAKCGRVRPPLRPAGWKPAATWDPACPACGGALRSVPTREEDRFVCSSVYAVTKMTQEELVMNFGAAYGLPTVALRFFNVHGPGQSLSNPYTGVAAIFLSRIKNGAAPAVYEDGNQTRDFVSVHDISRACVLALEKKEADFQVFNVGTGRATSVRELAERLAKLCGSDVRPKVLGTFRSGDVRHCFSDIGRIRGRLGFEPEVSLDDGLRELIDWSRGVRAVDRFDRAHGELKKRGLA
ncbi:MAG: NAD-dependent epimerase/dehydratase family protein [Planctomycetes bacterium]|nr:NAD-dependent epimerase/dehydratase family protein [Planctomycetota bacterium]